MRLRKKFTRQRKDKPHAGRQFGPPIQMAPKKRRLYLICAVQYAFAVTTFFYVCFFFRDKKRVQLQIQ